MTRLAVCEQVHKLPVQPLHRLGTSLQLCQQQSSSDCYVLIYLGPQGGKSQRHPCRAVDILCERDLNVVCKAPRIGLVKCVVQYRLYPTALPTKMQLAVCFDAIISVNDL